MGRQTLGERVAVLEAKAKQDEKIGREHSEIFDRLRFIESDLAVIKSRFNGPRLKAYAAQGSFLTAMVLAIEAARTLLI